MKYVDTETMAETLAITPRRLRNLVSWGKIPANAYLRVGRLLRFNPDAVIVALQNTDDLEEASDDEISEIMQSTDE